MMNGFQKNTHYINSNKYIYLKKKEYFREKKNKLNNKQYYKQKKNANKGNRGKAECMCFLRFPLYCESCDKVFRVDLCWKKKTMKKKSNLWKIILSFFF